MLNPLGLRDYSRRIADAVRPSARLWRVPIVLGGDCTLLIGNALRL